ncbi:MAG TPA: hypothetical protein PLU87_17335 [Sedimentisphaerales bacterium]|nr:hypothetical protein [Sedimentisphaerales bacterium]HRS12732.1 hypothetical protein [Sedimentisphaerales bacterium]HRV49352.1 hypothetical protein [Sedimentisphaerales bacterium]
MSPKTVRKKGSVAAAVVWMFVISLLLFWLPVFGPLIAGLVGGKRAGGVGPAIVAVFFPAIALGVFFLVFSTALTGMPVVGLLAGAGGFLLAASGAGMLLVGAIVGGVLA